MRLREHGTRHASSSHPLPSNPGRPQTEEASTIIAVAVLLTETELRAALEPLLERLLTERLRLFRLDLEPRMQALIQAALEPRNASELQEGLLRLRQTSGLSACFTALFELTEAWIGRQRALLVVHGGQVAVWKSSGLSLPARFPLQRQGEVLRGGSHLEVRVQDRVVGQLYWPGEALPAAARTKVELLVQWCGLLLLERALGSRPVAAVLQPAAAGTSLAPPVAGRRDGSPAQRFATLLVEDLKLYLQRERGPEFATGQATGDWRSRFAPELERCRRAFAERFAEGNGAAMNIFEEAAPRLVE